MKKFLLKTSLAVATLLTSITVSAHDFEVDGIYYSITDSTTNTVAVTYQGEAYDSYSNEYSGTVTIPSSVTYNGAVYSVTTIGDYAFVSCAGLSSVIIGESVNKIGDYAFVSCTNMVEVTIGNSVTKIGSYAFAECSGLVSMIIPNSVTKIGSYAFFYCTGLSSVIIGESVNKIGDYAFYSCTNMVEVTIGNSVTEIGEWAFYQCRSLTSVTIPNSVKTIGNYSFGLCTGLRSVSIGNSVSEIGRSAFDSCSGLTEISIPNSVNKIGDNAFSGTGWYNNQPDGILFLDNCCLCYKGDRNQLTGTLTLKENTRLIADKAFYVCSGLTSVTIPNSVIAIGIGAFSCKGLTQIIIENGNSNYDSRDNCNAIIETSTNTLISGCKNTIIPNSITSIGDNAFAECSGLVSMIIPNSVTKIGSYAFESCTGLTEVTIPNSVTKIGSYAFFSCTGLTSVTIPNSVTAIGERAFDGCWGLTEVNFNAENCTSSSSVFCTNITTIDIGDNVKSIPEYAFVGCSRLTKVTIPNLVATIGNFAFYGCTGLTEVSIGNSVTEIGNFTFRKCTGLTKVTSLNPEPPTCQSDCFYGVDVANCTLEVPAGAKEAYASADCWNDFVNIVEIVTVEVSTQENNATFEIPTTQGAVLYTVNVYSDEAMTQLVATTNYDASGNIILMSTSLELSIDGFADGSYYYDVIAKSESGETLSNYTGSFEIDTTGATGIEGLTSDETTATEVARYDIRGRLLSAPVKGINIVKYSDGTVKKIIHN